MAELTWNEYSSQMRNLKLPGMVCGDVLFKIKIHQMKFISFDYLDTVSCANILLKKWFTGIPQEFLGVTHQGLYFFRKTSACSKII